MRRLLPAGLLLLLLLAACAPGDPSASASRAPGSAAPASLSPGEAPRSATIRAEVVEVVDGDTIRVEIGGVRYAIRYIGIDAPETREPGAKAATRVNRQLVGDGIVLLESDVSDTDRFDRLLRYVWVERDGGLLLVNRELVRLGLALAKDYPPDLAYQDLLDRAERTAIREGNGLWEQPN